MHQDDRNKKNGFKMKNNNPTIYYSIKFSLQKLVCTESPVWCSGWLDGEREGGLQREGMDV